MDPTDTVLTFTNCVRLLGSSLEIDEMQLEMAMLNGLPNCFNGLLSVLHAVDSTGNESTFDFVRSRLLQEEQQMSLRASSGS